MGSQQPWRVEDPTKRGYALTLVNVVPVPNQNH